MKILAFHNREDIAALLADVEQITQVKIETAHNIKEFEKKAKGGDFDVAVVWDDFFIPAMGALLSDKKAPKTVCVLLEDENGLNRFLRLGITEANVETIPFNPLTFLVKLRGLQTTLFRINEALKKGHVNFDYYRFGLFNVLNALAENEKDLFLSVRNAEDDQILYTLKIEKGKVKGASAAVERIVEINTDDTIPKRIVKEAVEEEEVVKFEDTVDFYASLLEGKRVSPTAEVEKGEKETEKVVLENTPPKVEVSEEIPEELIEEEELQGLEPVRIESIRRNPFRERRIYSFPYKNSLVFTQPYEGLGGGRNAICLVPQVDEYTLSTLKILRVKNRRVKFLTCPLIKNLLKVHGFKEEDFIPPGDVAIYQFPFLASKLECAFYFTNGMLVTGTLFGSYVTRNVPYLKEVFLSHLKVFHRANITCREKLDEALRSLFYVRENAQYIIPAFGYPIAKKEINLAWGTLEQLPFTNDFFTIENSLKELNQILPKPVNSYEEFLQALKKLDPSTLFNLMDEFDALNIVPFEF